MKENCENRSEMSDGCKLHINEQIIGLNKSINDGFKLIGDRLLSVEIAVNSQVADMTKVKTCVDELKHGNGKKGLHQLSSEFDSHILSHKKVEDRLFQVILNYGGKAALVILNLFFIYKLYSNENINQDISDKQNQAIEQKAHQNHQNNP